MKKDLELNLNYALMPNTLHFQENRFWDLFWKGAMLPFASIFLAAGGLSLHFGSFIPLAFAVPATVLSVAGTTPFVEGRAIRRKILGAIKAKGIVMNRDEKLSLLRNLRSGNPEGKYLMKELDFDLESSWEGNVHNITIKVHQPERKDELNEAFYHALTINNAGLVANFSEEIVTNAIAETTFQKEITHRLDRLNELVKKNSLPTKIPYTVIVENDVLDEIRFFVMPLDSSFKSIEATLEKDLMKNLDAQYSAKQGS